jgi:hypothetical protein
MDALLQYRCVDIPVELVHRVRMHHLARLTIAARRRRRPRTGVWSLRAL